MTSLVPLGLGTPAPRIYGLTCSAEGSRHLDIAVEVDIGELGVAVIPGLDNPGAQVRELLHRFYEMILAVHPRVELQLFASLCLDGRLIGDYSLPLARVRKHQDEDRAIGISEKVDGALGDFSHSRRCGLRVGVDGE